MTSLPITTHSEQLHFSTNKTTIISRNRPRDRGTTPIVIKFDFI